MAGTKEGGEKTRATNLARDPDWYAKIGSIGGKVGKPRTFNAYDLQRNRLVAALGGLNSSRAKDKTESEEKKLLRMEKREVIIEKIKQLDAEEQR